MRYNVSQLLKGPVGAIRRYTLHEQIDNLDEEISPIAALDGEVQLLQTAVGVLATGDLHTSIELGCSRCLQVFSTPVHFSIEEEYFPTIDIASGAKLPITPETDQATLIDARNILDLTEVVRQDLLLALPPAPVCRSNCAGLCPNCGTNWNEGQCDCAPEEIDPRLAVLKQLLER